MNDQTQHKTSRLKMCQNDSNIKTKQFKQITLEDRLLIEHLSNKQNNNMY